MGPPRNRGSPPITRLQLAFDFYESEEQAAWDAAAYVLRQAHESASPKNALPPSHRTKPKGALRATPDIDPVSTAEPLTVDPLGDDEPPCESFSEADLADKALDIDYLCRDPEMFLEWLLLRNMRILTSVGNPDEKASVVEWMFAPAIDGHVLDVRAMGSGQPIPLVTARLPMSFHWICDRLGADPWQLRTNLRLSLSRASRGLLSSKRPLNQRKAKVLAETLRAIQEHSIE